MSQWLARFLANIVEPDIGLEEEREDSENHSAFFSIFAIANRLWGARSIQDLADFSFQVQE